MPITKDDLLSNPNLRRALSPKDAQLLGLLTPAQAQTAEVELTPDSAPKSPPPSTKPTSKEKKPGKPELQSHAEYLHWIKKFNRSQPVDKPLLALHADPTTPSGILPGWPDFTLFYFGDQKVLFIEFKRARQGILSPAQKLIIRYLTSLGHHVHIVTSSQDAITITQDHFGLSEV